MQAVMLAAGRGTRMGKLTGETPKPLLVVAGKTLLEHKFDTLPADIDEVIIVIGYLGDLIKKHIGDSCADKRVRYVVQENYTAGTADALWQTKEFLTDRFLVLMGDDLYSKDDTERCLVAKDWVMLVQKTEHMQMGGHVLADIEGKISDIEEGNHAGAPGLISTNMFVLDTRLFMNPLVPKAAGSEEYGLPQTVLAASRASGIPFTALESTFWFQITIPEDIEKAEEILGKIKK